MATAEYGPGRLALIPGRLNAVDTGGDAVSGAFRRRLFEWLSGISAGNNIAVAVTDISDSVAAVDVGLTQANMVSVERIEADRLSSLSALSQYDCLVIEGAGHNEISPISKSVIQAFISSGKGVLFLDFAATGTVSALPSGYDVDVSSADFEYTGRTKWTDDGLASQLYSESISDIRIPMVNLIHDSGLSAPWTVLAYHDTSTESVPGTESGIDQESYMKSSSYSFAGEYFIGRFASAYEKGVVNVQN